jgi:hypothetical protein
MIIIQYLGFSLLFGVSMYGWGTLLPGLRNAQGTALCVVLGMGITVVIGGVLNALQVAYGGVLNFYLALGILLSVVDLTRLRFSPLILALHHRVNRRALVASGLFIGVLTGLLSSSALVPDAFNFHDDYQKYFVHPVKLITTGSAFGSPLSSIGKEFLGGQALLQAFFVHNLGIRAFNVFDAVFCLLLAALLLIEQGFKRGVPWTGLLCALLLTLIHPQYVNVSALYSAVLFIIGAIILSAGLVDTPNSDRVRLIGSVAGLSICYTALAALKSTFVLFPAVHFLLFVLIYALIPARRATAAVLLVSVPLTSLLLVLPWALPILENAEILASGEKTLLTGLIGSPGDLRMIFSTNTEFYGGAPLQYTFTVLLVAAAGLTAILTRKKTGFEPARRTPAGTHNVGERAFAPTRPWGTPASAVSTGAGLVVLYLGILGTLQPQVHTFSTALRYTLPYLIGMGPVAILLFQQTIRERHGFRAAPGLLCLMTLAAALQFLPQAISRLEQSWRCGSSLAFSQLACSRTYRLYSHQVLNGLAGQVVEGWQMRIPAGAPVIAWINNPFYLDFNRNEVFEVDIAGLDNPWANLPDAKYLIWEHRGYATRPLSTLRADARRGPLYRRQVYSKTIDFINLIQRLEARADVHTLYQDGHVKIFRLNLGPTGETLSLGHGRPRLNRHSLRNEKRP